MKRDDIIAGIIGGTIFVVGCTVGILGYQKMNEPRFAQTSKTQNDYSSSNEDYAVNYQNGVIGVNQSGGISDERADSGEDYGVSEEVVITDYSAPEENSADHTNSDPENNIIEPEAIKIDPEVFSKISDNTKISVDASDDGRRNTNYFDTYDIEEQQLTSDSYVLNTSTLKIHYPSCKDVKKISPENYATTSESIDALIGQGYTRCGHCF